MKYEFIGFVKYILKLGERDFDSLVWYIGICLLSTLVARSLLTSGLGSWNNRTPGRRSRTCYSKNALAQANIAWWKNSVFWSNLKNFSPMIPLGYPQETHRIPIKYHGKRKTTWGILKNETPTPWDLTSCKCSSNYTKNFFGGFLGLLTCLIPPKK
jgi:hypothetical protein